MKHIRIISAAILTVGLAAPARGQFLPDGLSPFEQASRSDLIVVGKVTGMEAEPVLAKPVRGADKAAHMIATIRIDENLLGANGLTHLRVGFVSQNPRPAQDPNVKIFT